MYNKKVLIDSLKKLGSAKAPTQKKDIIIDPMGQWAHPGENTRIPSNRITMKGVNYPVLGIANTGQKQMMQPGQEYNFPGADYVDEYPQMRKGGLPNKKSSKKYSRSLNATNRLFAEHPWFKKPKSRKNKIYDPNSPYFQPGGETDLPQNVGITYLSGDDRSHYSPLDDTIYLNPNASDSELNHELVHAWQNRTGRLRSNPNLPQQRPPIVASDEQAASYYTRKGDDVDYYLNNLSTLHPNLTDGNIWTEDLNRFMPEQIKYDKVIEPLMYLDPNTMEGEAEMFSQVYGPPPGISFRKKGGALPKAQKGLSYNQRMQAYNDSLAVYNMYQDERNYFNKLFANYKPDLLSDEDVRRLDKWFNYYENHSVPQDAIQRLSNLNKRKPYNKTPQKVYDKNTLKNGKYNIDKFVGNFPKPKQPVKPKSTVKPNQANNFITKSKPCVPKTTVINNVPEKAPFGKKLVGTNSETVPVTGKKCEYVQTINPIYEDLITEPIKIGTFPLKVEHGKLPELKPGNFFSEPLPEAPQYVLDPYAADRLSVDIELPKNQIKHMFDSGVFSSKGHFSIGKKNKTRLIPRIVQKFTGYDPAYFEGYEDEEGNFIPGELDYGNETGGKMEFKGAASLRDFINQKKYAKEYEEYEKKLDDWDKRYEQSKKKQEQGQAFKKGGSLPKAQNGTIWVKDENDPRYKDYLIRQSLYNYSNNPNFNVRDLASFDLYDIINDNKLQDLQKYTNSYYDDLVTKVISNRQTTYPDEWERVFYEGLTDPNIGPYGSEVTYQTIPNDQLHTDQHYRNNYFYFKDLEANNNFFKQYPPLNWQKKQYYTDTPYIQAYRYVGPPNSYSWTKPYTLFIEDKFDRNALKRVYPNLTDAEIDKWVDDTRKNPSFITRNFTPQGYAIYADTYDRDKYIADPNKKTFIDNKGQLGYLPENITQNIIRSYDYIPVWPKPETIVKVLPPPIEIKGSLRVDHKNLPELQPGNFFSEPLPEAPQYALEPYTDDRLRLSIEPGKTKSKTHRGRLFDGKGQKYKWTTYEPSKDLELRRKEVVRPIASAIQKFTGYDPKYFEGYYDEEGNYIPGELEIANELGNKVEFKGAASLRDYMNQLKYAKEYEEYEKKLDEWNEKYEQSRKKQTEGRAFKYGGLSKFLDGGPQCPEGYTYNPETKRCTRKNTNCPEGYFFDAQEGRCKSKAYREKFELYNKGTKITPTEEEESYSYWPDDLTLKALDEDMMNNPEGFEVNRPFLIRPIKTIGIYNPEKGEYEEDIDDRYLADAYVEVYPDLNYQVVVDPSKPKGYNADKSIYYVPDENNFEFEKFKQYKKLKEIEKENLTNLAKYPNLITKEWQEDYKYRPQDDPKLFLDAEYYGQGLPGYYTNLTDVPFDKYKNSIKREFNTGCKDCKYHYGTSHEYNDDYNINLTNLGHVKKDFDSKDPYQEVRRIKEYDYVDLPDESMIPRFDLESADTESPMYREGDPSMLVPHMRLEPGKTKSKKHRGRLMDGKGQKYKHTTYKQTKDLEFGTHKTNRPIPALVQKFTGYDPKYYQGYNKEVGDETEYVPGEIERAEQEGRKINFKGAATLRDLKKQKEYDRQWLEYQKQKDEVRQRNEDYLKEYNITPEEYEQYYGPFRRGGQLPKAQYGLTGLGKDRGVTASPFDFRTPYGQATNFYKNPNYTLNYTIPNLFKKTAMAANPLSFTIGRPYYTDTQRLTHPALDYDPIFTQDYHSNPVQQLQYGPNYQQYLQDVSDYTGTPVSNLNQTKVNQYNAAQNLAAVKPIYKKGIPITANVEYGLLGSAFGDKTTGPFSGAITFGAGYAPEPGFYGTMDASAYGVFGKRKNNSMKPITYFRQGLTRQGDRAWIPKLNIFNVVAKQRPDYNDTQTQKILELYKEDIEKGTTKAEDFIANNADQSSTNKFNLSVLSPELTFQVKPFKKIPGVLSLTAGLRNTWGGTDKAETTVGGQWTSRPYGNIRYSVPVEDAIDRLKDLDLPPVKKRKSYYDYVNENEQTDDTNETPPDNTFPPEDTSTDENTMQPSYDGEGVGKGPCPRGYERLCEECRCTKIKIRRSPLLDKRGIHPYIDGKYLEDGGIIVDLTPEEIEEYAKGGYIVEDISVPTLTRMDKGGGPNTCPPDHYWNGKACVPTGRTFTPIDPDYVAQHPDEARRIQNEAEVTVLPNVEWLQDRANIQPDNIQWYESWNPKKWGLNDYSDYSSFNSAFRNARASKEDEFVYKNERYNTDLIPKEESDLYWESKNFLKDYYQNEPYRYDGGYDSSIPSEYTTQGWYIKNKYGTTWIDLYDKIQATNPNDPKYVAMNELLNKILEEESSITDKTNNDYRDYRDSIVKNAKQNLINERLSSLNKPSYFSITDQKPTSMSSDGYWDKKNNRTFMYTKTEPGKLNTTYVHELSHKGDDILDVLTTVPDIDIKKINESPYVSSWSQDDFDYVSHPSEIEARKLSTLFYLYKNKKPYKSGKITQKILDDLYTNSENLPYDIKQLLDLYGMQQDDLLKYLNSNYSYKEQKKQYGGEYELGDEVDEATMKQLKKLGYTFEKI